MQRTSLREVTHYLSLIISLLALHGCPPDWLADIRDSHAVLTERISSMNQQDSIQDINNILRQLYARTRQLYPYVFHSSLALDLSHPVNFETSLRNLASATSPFIEQLVPLRQIVGAAQTALQEQSPFNCLHGTFWRRLYTFTRLMMSPKSHPTQPAAVVEAAHELATYSAMPPSSLSSSDSAAIHVDNVVTVGVVHTQNKPVEPHAPAPQTAAAASPASPDSGTDSDCSFGSLSGSSASLGSDSGSGSDSVASDARDGEPPPKRQRTRLPRKALRARDVRMPDIEIAELSDDDTDEGVVVSCRLDKALLEKAAREHYNNIRRLDPQSSLAQGYMYGGSVLDGTARPHDDHIKSYLESEAQFLMQSALAYRNRNGVDKRRKRHHNRPARHNRDRRRCQNLSHTRNSIGPSESKLRKMNRVTIQEEEHQGLFVQDLKYWSEQAIRASTSHPDRMAIAATRHGYADANFKTTICAVLKADGSGAVGTVKDHKGTPTSSGDKHTNLSWQFLNSRRRDGPPTIAGSFSRFCQSTLIAQQPPTFQRFDEWIAEDYKASPAACPPPRPRTGAQSSQASGSARPRTTGPAPMAPVQIPSESASAHVRPLAARPAQSSVPVNSLAPVPAPVPESEALEEPETDNGELEGLAREVLNSAVGAAVPPCSIPRTARSVVSTASAVDYAVDATHKSVGSGEMIIMIEPVRAEPTPDTSDKWHANDGVSEPMVLSAANWGSSSKATDVNAYVGGTALMLRYTCVGCIQDLKAAMNEHPGDLYANPLFGANCDVTTTGHKPCACCRGKGRRCVWVRPIIVVTDAGSDNRLLATHLQTHAIAYRCDPVHESKAPLRTGDYWNVHVSKTDTSWAVSPVSTRSALLAIMRGVSGKLAKKLKQITGNLRQGFIDHMRSESIEVISGTETRELLASTDALMYPFLPATVGALAQDANPSNLIALRAGFTDLGWSSIANAAFMAQSSLSKKKQDTGLVRLVRPRPSRSLDGPTCWHQDIRFDFKQRGTPVTMIETGSAKVGGVVLIGTSLGKLFRLVPRTKTTFELVEVMESCGWSATTIDKVISGDVLPANSRTMIHDKAESKPTVQKFILAPVTGTSCVLDVFLLLSNHHLLHSAIHLHGIELLGIQVRSPAWRLHFPFPSAVCLPGFGSNVTSDLCLARQRFSVGHGPAWVKMENLKQATRICWVASKCDDAGILLRPKSLWTLFMHKRRSDLLASVREDVLFPARASRSPTVSWQSTRPSPQTHLPMSQDGFLEGLPMELIRLPEKLAGQLHVHGACEHLWLSLEVREGVSVVYERVGEAWKSLTAVPGGIRVPSVARVVGGGGRLCGASNMVCPGLTGPLLPCGGEVCFRSCLCGGCASHRSNETNWDGTVCYKGHDDQAAGDSVPGLVIVTSTKSVVRFLEVIHNYLIASGVGIHDAGTGEFAVVEVALQRFVTMANLGNGAGLMSPGHNGNGGMLSSTLRRALETSLIGIRNAKKLLLTVYNDESGSRSIERPLLTEDWWHAFQLHTLDCEWCFGRCRCSSGLSRGNRRTGSCGWWIWNLVHERRRWRRKSQSRTGGRTHFSIVSGMTRGKRTYAKHANHSRRAKYLAWKASREAAPKDTVVPHDQPLATADVEHEQLQLPVSLQGGDGSVDAAILQSAVTMARESVCDGSIPPKGVQSLRERLLGAAPVSAAQANAGMMDVQY